ncbi:MAG: hypothetical protein QOF33_3339 [Thermomicrobiales bacterium]|jgi:hypothetical protein|nr:hypothetical protein [Thermomicrobiales bacterium]
MLSLEEKTDIAFAGSPEEQRIAREVFAVMRAQGRFMSSDAPIRVSLDSARAFLAQTAGEDAAARIERVLELNTEIFALLELDEHTIIETTRGGRVPRQTMTDRSHTFARRFMTPLPKPEAPERPVRERPRVDPSWATLDQLLAPFDAEEFDLDLPTVQEVPEPEEPVAEVAAPEAPLVEVEEEVPVEIAPARTITVPAAPQADVARVDDIELASAIAERLRTDSRIANFGDQWMLEDQVPRFSRGDLRRLKDYIQEQEQPLTDDVLVQDVLGIRPTTPDFDLMRFAVNFRLSREHREFDFVGTANQRFWSTSNLPQIGTTRRKPNEIGTDYRYLTDELSDQPAQRSVKSVDHVISFYEYYLGLLPYDADMQALLPAPLLPNQRSAVLTFETPQSYTTYLVELRYPTPNRGGFILGLDDFFTENLVPGALISIKRTDNDGHYLVEYLSAGNQSARLLELEDRRQRYVFRPTSYACGVEDSFLLTEERFPHFGSEKPLDEKIRRRPESVVAATFERLGHRSDTQGFWATFEDLLAAVNIERPFSERYLRSILENDETGAFARDPDGSDAYTYVPGTTS